MEFSKCDKYFCPPSVDGLLVPPGNANYQLTDHLIACVLLRSSEPVQEKG